VRLWPLQEAAHVRRLTQVHRHHAYEVHSNQGGHLLPVWLQENEGCAFLRRDAQLASLRRFGTEKRFLAGSSLALASP
jgi:hypothetical protein